MNAKDLQIDYYLAWESPQVEQARRLALRSVLRTAISLGGHMKVFTPSTYLKWQDLDGQDWVVTIREVKKEEIKSQDGSAKEKFVLYFKEHEKGLVLNTTNIKTLYKLYGTDESDEFIGKKLTLYVKDDVEYGGELVSAIRIRTKLPL